MSNYAHWLPTAIMPHLAAAEQQRRRATGSLLNFTMATFPGYRAGWFHRQLAERLDVFLQDVIAGRRPRIIVTSPPQHGKTELVSQRFPAYALGKFPNLAIVATSYNAIRAEQVSSALQKIMLSERYRLLFPNTCIAGIQGAAKGARRKDFFEIVGHAGSYRACGIGGGLTGMRADILIIDDPVKDDAAAQSAVWRQKTWDWFVSAAYPRVSSGGGIILVQTRWHQDDLAGRILQLSDKQSEEQNADNWILFDNPAIAEKDSSFRKIGEPLCPARYSLEALLAIKRTLGSYKWNALYQQHPSPPEGGIIKRQWIQTYSAQPKRFDEVIQSWDLSFASGESSDFVAGHVWGRRGANYCLLDRVHARMDFPQTIEAIRRLESKWHQEPLITAVLIELAANGSAVVSMLKNELPGVIGVKPEGSKQARMYAAAPLFEAGNVFVPEPTKEPWAADVVEEWVSFPHAAHDDDCDAMTQALLRLRLHPNYGPPPIVFGSSERVLSIPEDADVGDEQRQPTADQDLPFANKEEEEIFKEYLPDLYQQFIKEK